MAVEEKIITRIKALLAMASHPNSNENEAATAMRRAHSLLAQHNLNLADMTAEEQKSAEPYTSVTLAFKERFRPYGRTIAMGIAELNFCKMFYSRSERQDTYTFVGRETNVTIARMVAESVLAVLVKQAKQDKHPGFQTNFMAGASQRVYFRCQEMIAESSEGRTKLAKEDTTLNVTEADNGKFTLSGSRNLPAMLNTYIAEKKGAEDYIKREMGIALRTRSSSASGGRGGHEGRLAGDAAGRNVSLRPGLGNTKAIR